MQTSDKIAAIALVVALISAIFTGIFAGLTYFSGEASKRDEMGIFILRNQYAIRWDNSSNSYRSIFIVSGIISNEGPRSCQVTQLVLHITFPISPSKYSTAQSVNFQEFFVNGTTSILDWDNTIFEVSSQKNFTLTMTLEPQTVNYPLGDSFSNLKNTDIQGNIHLEYNDVMGTIAKEQSITNWVQIDALF